MGDTPQEQAQKAADQPGPHHGDVQYWLDQIQGSSGAPAQSQNFVNGFPDGHVFLGGYNSISGMSNAPRGREDTRTPGTMYAPGDYGPHLVTVADSQNWLLSHYEANDAVYQNIRKTMIDAGLISPSADITTMLGQWAQYSSLSNMAGNRGTFHTPQWYMAHQDAAQQIATSTEHSTSTSVNYTSRASAAGDFQQEAQQTLGRRATAKETAGAYAAIHAAEVANPNTTTSTGTRTTNNLTGNSTSRTNSVTTGGLDAGGTADILQQQAMSAHDYAEYQAAGVMFPWLLQALSATANVPTG